MSRVAPPRKALNALYNVRFEPSPKPFNCTTFPATELIAQNTHHPLHIPIMRRLETWNPNRLHWAVRVPVAASKKRTMRSWAARRFRDAFIHELENNGFNRRGEPIAKSGSSLPLTGALSVTLYRPVLTASIQDVRDVCKLILKKNIMGRKKS